MTSRSIYGQACANRYYLQACVLGGFKTPAISFILQGQTKKKVEVSRREWKVQIHARIFFVFQHYWLWFHIIFVFHIINKCNKVLQWLGTCHAILGTWVRFPGPLTIPILFFHWLSCAALQGRFIISPIDPTSQVSSKQIQRTKSREHHSLESSML